MVDAETYLREREREVQHELEQLEQRLLERRVALEMVRQWRADLAKSNGSVRPEQESLDDSASDMPRFDHVTDPTGRRRAIWNVLNDRRGKPVTNAELLKDLIRRGDVTPDTELKDLRVTAQRMAAAKQIHKAGRGAWWLPEKS